MQSELADGFDKSRFEFFNYNGGAKSSDELLEEDAVGKFTIVDQSWWDNLAFCYPDAHPHLDDHFLKNQAVESRPPPDPYAYDLAVLRVACRRSMSHAPCAWASLPQQRWGNNQQDLGLPQNIKIKFASGLTVQWYPIKFINQIFVFFT